MHHSLRPALGLACAIALLCHLQAMAQDQTAENPAPAPCSGPEFHQFDFWIGEWDVTANDQPAGTNSIQPVLGGCVLNENWEGAGGSRGSSFNIYDKARGRWHQTWVDNSGTLLELDGGLEHGSMVLRGESPAAQGGGMTTHRITWTPAADGSVRQLWDATTDGENWIVLFDGHYVRRKAD